jgi:hypothetical protein
MGSRRLRRWRQAAKSGCTCAKAAAKDGLDLVAVFVGITCRKD